MEGNFGLAPWYRRAIERKEAALEGDGRAFADIAAERLGVAA